jgi:hypothetical protein
VWSVLLHLWLLSCVQSLPSLGRCPAPPRYLYTHFPQTDGKLDCSLRDLQSDDLSEGFLKYLLASQTYLLFHASVPYAVVEFQLRPLSILELWSFRSSSYSIVPAWSAFSVFSSLLDCRSYMTASLTPCRTGTASHPPVGGGQLLPGPTITLAPFLRALAVPCG